MVENVTVKQHVSIVIKGPGPMSRTKLIIKIRCTLRLVSVESQSKNSSSKKTRMTRLIY